MMNMQSKNQYLQTLLTINGYYLTPKHKKTKLLDEYCRVTGLNRKYVIRKIRSGNYLPDKTKTKQRKRSSYYDGQVTAALAACWKIFDKPCGQRLEPLLKDEVDRLRNLGELKCSDIVAEKLKEISFRSVDEKLKHEKEVERQKQKRQLKVNPLLYQKIPVKVAAEQDRTILGNLQIDLVEHCGSSQKGEYINTLATTDINTGWWEGAAIMGKSQRNTYTGLQQARKLYPFNWLEIHSDNGSEFINNHLYRYTQIEKLGFSRSRPYKKNDNCFVEQKNWTHVKRQVGYLRYDTKKELKTLNELYQNELRFYKNFFQPVMKLISKERVGGKIKRRYDKARTPYQRVMESKQVPAKAKQELTKIYESLNPAELKRAIDKKLALLYQAYQEKNKSTKKVVNQKKLTSISVTSLIAQPDPISVT